MTQDKLTYQVDQLEYKVKQLHAELDELNDEFRKVEKDLLLVKGEATVVGTTVNGIVETRGWAFKAIGSVFIAAACWFVIGGGLDK
tara:strand:+ start:1387 stop:1644 length:258 start_codon:yes stop_codon:yes gene_type:complete